MKAKDKIDLDLSLESERFAGIYSLKSTNPNERKRSFATIILIYSLAEFFRKQNLKVLNSKNLFKVPKLSEQFEISDLYVNNYRLDVRLALKDDCFYIPKAHYEYEILPDFYVVVSIDKKLKKPKFVGFITPDELEKEDFNAKYYKSSTKKLKDMTTLLSNLKEEKNISLKSSDHRIFNNNIISYIDDEADNYTIAKILKHVLECAECRSELINFYGFEIIARETNKHSSILQDDSLDVIGAIEPENSNYKGQEANIPIYDENYSDFEQDYDNFEQQFDGSSFAQENLSELSNINQDSISKEKAGVILDGLFENVQTPNKKAPSKKSESPSVIPDPSLPTEISEENMEIITDDVKTNQTPQVPTGNIDIDFLAGDIDILQDSTEENVPQEKLTSLKDFLSNNTPSDSKENSSKIDINDITSIPDEMFNESYSDNQPSHTQTKSDIKNIKKIIVDYDEYGQPVYEETEQQDEYTIVEKEIQNEDIVSIDEFTKTQNDTTKNSGDSITEEQTKYIEVDTENFTDEYNGQKQKQTGKARLYMLICSLLIVTACYFVVTNYNEARKSHTIQEENVDDFDNMDLNALEDIISKNVQNESKFVKLHTVNWICNTALLQNEEYKLYLKTIDRRFKAKFKLNSNSILKAPYSNIVSAEILVNSLGVVKTYRISQSSGVEEIDNIVLQSVKEAVSKVEVPQVKDTKLNTDEYYLKVVLKF